MAGLSGYHAVLETYSWDGSFSHDDEQLPDCNRDHDHHGDEEEPEAEPGSKVAIYEERLNAWLVASQFDVLSNVFAHWCLEWAVSRWCDRRVPAVTHNWGPRTLELFFALQTRS